MSQDLPIINYIRATIFLFSYNIITYMYINPISDIILLGVDIMKKIILLTLSLIILLSPVISHADSFSDINSDDWYYESVMYIRDKGIFNGYTDGTFRPAEKITRGEFIKSVLSVFGYNNLVPTSQHWASGYLDKGLELGIICSHNSINLDERISRFDMARIISNVLSLENSLPQEYQSLYEPLLNDVSYIRTEEVKDSVLHAFSYGILTGYPSMNFEGDRQLSRAEAATVILRIMDKSQRIPPQLDYISAYQAKILQLTNIEREKVGLHKLTLWNELSIVAMEKSKDMATFNYFAHISPNYGSPFEMMTSFGIKYMAAAENLAYGQRTPEEVVQAWMNSKGHKDNILNRSYNRIGIGVYFDRAYYWTQMFTN